MSGISSASAALRAAARGPGLRVLAVTVILIAAIYAVAIVVIDGSFGRLEQKEIERSVELVAKTLEADNTQIEIVSRDYARWDDMYQFVTEPTADFIDQNFSQAGLTEMGIDITAIIDTAGRVVFSVERQNDGDRYFQPAPDATRAELELARDRLIGISDEVGGIRYLWMAGRPFIVSVHKVTHSDRSGPSNGYLLFARALDADVVARLSETSKQPLVLAPVADSAAMNALSATVRSWAAGARNRDWLSLPVSEASIEGYTVVADIAGNAGLVLGTAIARDVLSYGKRTRQAVVGAVALLVALAATLFLLLLRRAARAAASARANEARYRAVVSNASEAIVVFDCGTRRILESNAGLERLTGRPLVRLLETPIDDLFDRRVGPKFESVRVNALTQNSSQEARLLTAHGSLVDVELSISPLSVDQPTQNCLIVHDISHRKQAEDQLRAHHRSLEHLAHHDSLTGLPNRLYLNSRLPDLLEETRAEGGVLGLFYLDFDHFKRVNDLAGHHVGDQLLQAMAGRLKNQVGARDLVIRMGGDEFVIISRSADRPSAFESLARRIIDALQVPVRISEQTIPAAASVGVCVFPNDAGDVVGLLQCADLALYSAKRQGRNRYQFFELSMVEQTRARVALEHELRHALETDAIGIHLQPIVELATRRVVGFEALARWTHERLGEIPPARFVPVAEESGLIADLGLRTLKLAARQLVEWRARDLEIVPIHINVSAKQFDRGRLAEQILEVAHANAIAPELLHVELTESTVMSGHRSNVEALHQLRDAGIRVSVDDFGTGYSSLSYLKHLPIDYLKIDRSFVRDMGRDPNDEAIVAAIISMAQRLKLHVIAEGVETADQAERLQALGCEYAQGYYFGRPMRAEQCANLLRELERRERYSETLRLRVIDGGVNRA